MIALIIRFMEQKFYWTGDSSFKKEVHLMTDLNSDVYKKILLDYRSTISGKLEQLQQLVDALHQNASTETLQALRLLVHKLAGNAGTYGYMDVTIHCKKLDVELLRNIEEFNRGQTNPVFEISLDTYLQQIKKGYEHATE